MSVSEQLKGPSLSFSLIPWERAVWPGTLELLTEADDLMDKLLSGLSCYRLALVCTNN